MNVVILAGGFGTRISEYTKSIPKPMIKINKDPIIVHIMRHYYNYGFKNFFVALGYKGEVIRNFFKKKKFPWKVNLINTGLKTMTGGRLKRLKKYLKDETFLLTYGDGVSDVNIKELITQHKNNDFACTLTAVQPQARFGALEIDSGNIIKSFHEKPKGDGVWINGGFMVCEPEIFNFIEDDKTIWEQYSLPKLAKEGKLASYKHRGFWRPMDTLKDKYILNDIWKSNKAKWKLWE